MAQKKKLKTTEYLRALARVFMIAFRLSKSSIALRFTGSIIDAAFPIALTFLAARITTKLVDVFQGNQAALDEVLWLVVITAVLGIVQTAWASVSGYLGQVIRYRVESAVDDMMYSKYLSLEFWRYDDKYTNDLKDRANKFSYFFSWIFSRLFDVLSNIISVVFSIVALAYVSPYLSLAIFLALIPAIAVRIKLTREQLKHWDRTIEVRRKQNAIQSVLLEARTIIETRIYGLTRHLMNERMALRDQDEKARLVYEKRYIKWQLLGDVVESLAQLGSLVWIVLQIAAQKQPIGQFLYVQQLVGRVSTSMNSLIGTITSMDEDLANLKDYDEFMQLPSASIEPNKITSEIPHISFQDVWFKYPDTKKYVITKLSLTITPGDHVAIVGENGAGKSTLIKLLLGVYRPTKGHILIDGQPLEHYDLSSWHDKIGILFQDFERFEFASVKDNVRFGKISKQPSNRAIFTALERAKADTFVRQLPKSVDTVAGTIYENENGTQLSGGQWQRLAIARNFFRDARILILDEPTSAIDAKAEAEIFDEINSEMKGRTTMTISHHFSTVRKADHIIVMEKGTIMQSGTHSELMQHGGRYKDMFDTQAEGYR